jgi:hypothetical protein
LPPTREGRSRCVYFTEEFLAPAPAPADSRSLDFPLDFPLDFLLDFPYNRIPICQ